MKFRTPENETMLKMRKKKNQKKKKKLGKTINAILSEV